MLTMGMKITADKLGTDASLHIKLEAGAQHMDLPAPNGNVESIGQCVTLCGHSLVAGKTQTLTMMIQNTFTTTHQDIEEGTRAVLEIFNPCLKSILHIPGPYRLS